AEDLADLEKVQETVQAHCDELESILDFLNGDPSATYKQLKKDIDERDTKIRAGRAATRQALADAEPRISRSVPRINKLIAEAEAAARQATREQKEAAAKADKAAADKEAADKAAADKEAADKAAAEKSKPVEVKATKPTEVKPTKPAEVKETKPVDAESSAKF